MPLSGIFFVSLHHQSNRKIMFRKTDPNPQLDIFTAPSMQLGSRASKKYSDPNSWHNQFYSLVTTKIDEEIFKPLFPEGKKSGRPNASIRILVAMSVLKEGFGCSDEDLFEKCEFDLLTRKALGMELLTDITPSIDTYYLFRRRICEYQERTGIDLMQLCFEQLAGKHLHLLKISGKCVRMDSKLIGSNIARQSRYELIHTTLVKFLKTGKMQGGCRWELIPHDEDGLTVREIATGNTYEAVKAVTKQGSRKRWRIPWNNKTGWRYFEDKDIKAYQLRKQIESLPLEEQHKRNNVEAAMFQYSFHTRNGKTRYRGLLKHRMHAYSRCMWMNLRRMVIFQISTFQRSIFALFGPIREAFGSFKAISRKIFTSGADCYVSLRMTTLVMLDSKYAPF